ncbi:hypothetical protein [Vitiosangium sp. GDMCC 1.1324]|uniref:hypothetical protein n=1 Tax=Vitiosangium sp. (strain GDMCC 1.1324) TaxID=2138576 RepID=UPI000D341377|nr:hypothetical protein [Vitiosangium sp. GDMCC 1.1324]PTL75973.1 hypothetical protein DAT35_51510 [Vitiosangium sp. GDMCC 1.1324]
MTEKELYAQKLEGEKQALDARLAEMEAQKDVDAADEKLYDLRVAREKREAFAKKLEEFRAQGQEYWQGVKADVDAAVQDYARALEKERQRSAQRREVSSQKREAELRQFDAQVDQISSLLKRNSAEDLLLTGQEFELIRGSLNTVRQFLARLRHTEGSKNWDETKAQFEQVWRDFLERSRKITSASAEEQPPAHP